MRPHLDTLSALTAALTAALCAGGCEKPSGPTFFIQGPGELKVSGFVSNRMDGEPVEVSRIDFRGYGALALWQRVHHGRYQVHGLAAGTYEVVVVSLETWHEQLHHEHRTVRVDVRPDSLEFDFTVLVWDSLKFGVRYDREFDGFFNDLARVGEGRDAVWKWTTPPSSIYVTREGISDPAFDEFLSILQEANGDTVPDLFGGTAGPLAIESGPPIGDDRPGTIVVRFHDGATRSDLSVAADGSITGAGVRFSSETFDDTLGPPSDGRLKRARLAHELWHCAGATHVADPGSLMYGDPDGSVTALSPRDKLAAWLMYHPDTHPGNRAPDINPTYRAP